MVKEEERWARVKDGHLQDMSKWTLFVMDHTVLQISRKMGIFLSLFFNSSTVTVQFQCYSTNLQLKIVLKNNMN